MFFSVWVIILLLASVISAMLAQYSARQNKIAGSMELSLLLTSITIWTLSEGIASASTSLEIRMIWTKISYIGSQSTSVLFLVFVLRYIGRAHIINKFWQIVPFFLIPFLTVLIAFVDKWHPLLWPTIKVIYRENGITTIFYHGVWFYVSIVYNYLLVVLGFIFLFVSIYKYSAIYNRITRLLFISALLPFITNLVYILDPAILSGLDPTPLSFLITSIFIIIAIFRFSFLDITPIARESVVENMRDGVVVLNNKGMVVEMNAVVRNLFSVQKGEVLPDEFTSNESWKMFMDTIRNRKETFEIIEDSSVEKQFSLHYTKLTNEKENSLGELVMIYDVTAQKKYENQLMESKKVAEAASKAKSEFLANMSHEIRTPMNGVIGLTDLMFTTELTDLQRNYLENISYSATSLLDILNDLLDFSKIESGRLEIQMKDFNIRELIEQNLKSFGSRASEKNIELMFNCSRDIPALINTDPSRIRQIFINLLNNAIKYTDRGEVLVSIQIQSEGRMTLAVKDTGVGISKDKQEVIFESFMQVDSSSSRRFGGTGLGLTISRQLATLLGGEIVVESEPGAGSEFKLIFPYSAPEEQPEIKIDFLSGKKILLVDDNEKNVNIIKDILERMGAIVFAAHDADEITKHITSDRHEFQRYDNYYIDASMHGNEGACTEKILNAIDNKGRVVLMMNYIESETYKQIYEKSGVRNFLIKPATITEIRRISEKIQHEKGIPDNISAKKNIEEEKKFSLSEMVKVLIVEDNTVNMKVIKHRVELMGATCEIAFNGVEAMELIKTKEFNLILMDIHMPVMNGYEAAFEIRKGNTKNSTIPIIALTADIHVKDNELYVQAGFNDCILKPFTVEKIQTVFEHFISKELMEKSANNNPSKPAIDSKYKHASDFGKSQLLLSLDNDESIVKTIVTLFLSEFPKLNEELRKAIDDKNYEGIRFHAHSIKGMCSGVFAEKMRLIAELIEHFEKNDLSVEMVNLLYIKLNDAFVLFKKSIS